MMKIPSPLPRLYVSYFRVGLLYVFYISIYIYISRNITDDNRDKVGYNDSRRLLTPSPKRDPPFKIFHPDFESLLSSRDISKILPLVKIFFPPLPFVSLEFERKEERRFFLLSWKKEERRNLFQFFSEEKPRKNQS